MVRPNWRNLDEAHLPPFPERAVREMLARFGIDPPGDLEPWPHGPSDVLARFSVDNDLHLLKGRHIEQRGERSLMETQRLQQLLLSEGLPVPSFLATPSGETLVKGPDWEEEGAVLYYEIQRQVPGEHFVATPENLRRAGALIARFHEVGAGIDTFLLNKSMYIGVFRQRGFEARERLRQQLIDAGGTDGERQTVDVFFERARHPSRQVYLDWRTVHGDLSTENILAAGDDLFLVDWDEIGLCPKTSDHGDLLGGLPDVDEVSIRDFIDAYRHAGGHLGAPDLESIHNGMVLQALRKHVEEPDGTTIGQVFDRFAFLLKD